MSERNTDDTQRSAAVSTKLRHISEKAKQDRDLRFTSLAHLITVDFLRESFQRLRKDAAAGVDGVTWADYSVDLDQRLKDLHTRLREGRYRAQPVRRAYIEKENGELRPLGVTSLEDKIVQRAVVSILEAIYEQDFHSFSHGYRPGRRAWDGLDALKQTMLTGRVNLVLDADIKGYFDAVVQRHLMEFLRRRVADRSVLRLIAKWLQAGVLDEGRLLVSQLGVAQGAVISPLLANVYLHHVLDEWWVCDVLPRLSGRAHIVRYADDFVMAFQHVQDAERVMAVLHKRFARYGLELHPTKTQLLPFGRFAREWEVKAGGHKPKTFNFLGFTHISGVNRHGSFAYQVRTMASRLRRSLTAIAQWCRANRHLPLDNQRETLARKMEGHYGYYGRRTNYRQLVHFYMGVRRLWYKWLNRRDQRHRLTASEFNAMLRAQPLPCPRITEPAALAFEGSR